MHIEIIGECCSYIIFIEKSLSLFCGKFFVSKIGYLRFIFERCDDIRLYFAWRHYASYMISKLPLNMQLLIFHYFSIESTDNANTRQAERRSIHLPVVMRYAITAMPT